MRQIQTWLPSSFRPSRHIFSAKVDFDGRMVIGRKLSRKHILYPPKKLFAVIFSVFCIFWGHFFGSFLRERYTYIYIYIHTYIYIYSIYLYTYYIYMYICFKYMVVPLVKWIQWFSLGQEWPSLEYVSPPLVTHRKV